MLCSGLLFAKDSVSRFSKDGIRHGGEKLPNGLDISGWWRLAHSRKDGETVVEAITPSSIRQINRTQALKGGMRGRSGCVKQAGSVFGDR